MTDEWAIASLGQVMEGDDDDDDVLIPPTPGQEDIDIAAATQDNSSLLGAMADSLAAGRRKLNTLSLGLSDDPESESLPFLALEWDSQFPTTPAPANGQSAESYFLNKDKEDSHSKSRHSNESCNGQSSVWEGCSASWLTKDAEASGIRTVTGTGGDENHANKSKEKEKSEQMKKNEKNVDDRGGGSKASGDGCGKGGGGDDGDDDDEDENKNNKTKKDEKEEEESSHEPSSDSSEGLLTVHEDCNLEETVKASTGDSVSGRVSKTSSSVRSAMELGEVEVGSSQRDLFLSQTDPGEAVLQRGDSLGKHLGEKDIGVVCPPASLGPILRDDDDDDQPSSEKMLPHTSFAATSSSKTPVSTQATVLHAMTPSKRKIAESDSDGGTSEIPFKQPRTEDRSGSSESGEERVFIDYTTLTKKDVEISPKRQKQPPRSFKPPQSSFATKRITFGRDESRDIKAVSQNPRGSMIDDMDPTLPIADKEDGDIEFSDLPQRLPADTEEENSDNSGNSVRKSIDLSYKVTLESREASDKEDSDVEIIEDKDRSIEVVYEKSKPKSTFCEDVGSQDFSLILSGTQHESPDLNEPGQRFSEEPSFSAEGISQRLCPLSGSEDLACHGTVLSSIDDGSEVCITSDINTMPATQVEELCHPAVLTQPDIEPLISLPLSNFSDFRKKIGKTVCYDKEKLPEEKKLTSHDSCDSKFNVKPSRSESGHQLIREQSLSSTVAKLQMPDILTPSTQDLAIVPESESVFLKAATAARERAHQEEKRIEEKRKLEVSGSKSDSSLECMDVSVSKFGEQSLNDGSRVDFTSCDSTPVSGLQHAHSSQSTPVTSQPQRLISHSTTLFGSGKKENVSSLSLQSFADETDSEDEGPVFRKKKKSRTKPSQPSEVEIKSLSAVKKDIIKTSTPNTSQGISPNITGVSGSDIDKDQPGIEVVSDTSKSRNTSSEQSKISKSSETAPFFGTGVSSQDTEILMVSENNLSVDELLKAGYKEIQRMVPSVEFQHPVTQKTIGMIIDPAYVLKHPLSNEISHVIFEGEHGSVSKIYLQQVSGLASGSSNIGHAGRLSDASMLSRISSSSGSGYLGDKSSSYSSGSSHRLSMFSTTESSRLSLGSVVTLPSPPHEKRDKDITNPYKQGDDGKFLAPVGRAKHQPLVKIDVTSSKPNTVDAGTSTRKTFNQKLYHPDQDISTSSSEDLPSKKNRGRGIVKNQDKNNGAEPSSGQSNRGKGRGRSRGRGRGRATAMPQKRNNKAGGEGEIKSLDNPANDQETGDVVNLEKDVPKKELLSGTDNPISELIGSLPENLWALLENSQVPLSEEEEEVFVSQGGADNERQLAQVMKRVREVDLKPGLLVFARFVDNNFYSAILKERDGSDRWLVQYLLDQHSYSVRDVYLLPTDVLPRSHACFVRHHTEQFSDPCVVKAHVHAGSTLLHVVETDRGITKHIPHSHIFLTAQQAQELLQARLNFRSMVASPGREVSLDNIVAGRRRRTPNVLASPRSRKVDDNLDSSESATGEYDDLSTLVGQSPRGRKAASRGRAKAKRQDLSVLTEESDIELENPSTPSTPRGRKLSNATRKPRTPRTPKTSVQMSIVPKSTTSELAEAIVGEILREHTPLKKRGRPLGQSSSAHTPEKLLKLDEDTPSDLCLEPPPSEDSQIFKGFVVLLSSGDSSIRKRQNSEDEDLLPFNKDSLKEQFLRGGGKVIETYSEAEIIVAEEGTSLDPKVTTPKSKKTNIVVLLISNTYCRTPKFIQCLALGIPIVSFQWIIHSSSQNRCLDWKQYLLPSGEDENGELVEQRFHLEGDCLFSSPQVFKGESIFLATSSNLEFTSLYRPLLSVAGAEVRFKTTKMSNLSRALVKTVTVVVADATIPDKELKRAQTLNIPVVSTEWVIQSVIAGKRRGYRDHPKFLHDAAVSSTSPDPDNK